MGIRRLFFMVYRRDKHITKSPNPPSRVPHVAGSGLFGRMRYCRGLLKKRLLASVRHDMPSTHANM